MDTNVLHTPDTIYSARHLPSWFLLAGAAGLVNGVAFIECEQFATHVSGTATRFGLDWPRPWLVMEFGIVLLAFLAGAMTSVLAIQARSQRGERPRWASPLLLVALILTGTSVAGWLGVFGKFGGVHDSDPPPVFLLSLLAFAMGLQNAAVSTTTGLAVRTSHLTGPMSDLGVHIGTILLWRGEERRKALKGAILRGGKVISFVMGAALSLPLVSSLGFLSLVVPACFVLVAAVLSFVPDWGPSDFPDHVAEAFPRGSKPVATR